MLWKIKIQLISVFLQNWVTSAIRKADFTHMHQAEQSNGDESKNMYESECDDKNNGLCLYTL